MKNSYRLFLFCLFLSGLSLSVQAQQMNILALRYDPETGTRSFIHYNPFTNGISLEEPIESFVNVVFGTSTLDPVSSTYYVAGWADNSLNVTGIYAPSGRTMMTTNTGFTTTKEAEFDYRTGELYGLQRGRFLEVRMPEEDSIYAMDFIRTDPQSGTIRVINEVGEFNAFVLNTSCYNSNEGIYIVAGVNTLNNDGVHIYWIEAESGTILRRTEALDYGIGELLYDNLNDRLIGIMNNGNGVATLVNIDSNGVATPLTTYEIRGYVASNSAYDQASSLFAAMVLEPGATTLRTVVINTMTGEVVSNVEGMPNINEWEVDNTAFATALYRQPTSVKENISEGATAVFYPNPITGNGCRIQTPDNQAADLRLYTSNGIEVLRTRVNSNDAIDLSLLGSGIYTAVVQNTGGISTSRLTLLR